ncbi:MAG: hypothetical protein WBB94_04495 [Candidatus Saccharimonadaceae bacterium]
MVTPKKKKTTSKKGATLSTKKIISSTKKPRLSPKQTKLAIVLAVVVLGAGGYAVYSLYQKSLSDAASRGGSACSLDGARIVNLEDRGFYNGKTRLSGAGVKVIYDRYDKNSYCIKAWSSSGKKIISEDRGGFQRASLTANWKPMQTGSMIPGLNTYYKQSAFSANDRMSGTRFTYTIKYGGKTYKASTSVLAKR